MTVDELIEHLQEQSVAGHGKAQALVYHAESEDSGIVRTVVYIGSREEFPYVKADHPSVEEGVFIYGR